MGRRAYRLGVCAAALAAALLAGEWGVRAASPQPTASTFRERPGYYAPSDRYPLRLAAGLSVLCSSPEFSVRYDINERGLRDRLRPLPKAPGVLRIACLGDSFTFGHGVGMEEAWPSRLEAELDPGRTGGVEAWNLGYAAGFSPDAYALYARRELAALSPDVVVVQLFPFNDLDDIRNNRWEEVGPDGLPGRIASTLNFIDSEGRRLSRDRYPLRLRLPLLRESQLFQLAARVATRGDGLGRPLSLTDYCRRVHRKDLVPELREPWARFQRSMEALDAAVRGMGARLLVVTIPTLLQLADRPEYRAVYLDDPAGPFDPEEPDRRIAAFLASRGIACLGLLEAFRAAGLPPEALYYPRDGHLSPEGQARAGIEVAGALRALGWAPAAAR